MHFGSLIDIDMARDKSPAISAGVSPRKAVVATLCLAAVAAGANPLPVYKVVVTVGPWLLGKRVL
jgi:hypothetical protein